MEIQKSRRAEREVERPAENRQRQEEAGKPKREVAGQETHPFDGHGLGR
jgi:hypothetical protein